MGPGSFPSTGDGLAALAVAGVYLRIKQYDGQDGDTRTVSYVGQSTRLIVRFDQHLRDILTFSSALRDDSGAVALARDGANRFEAYNALEDVLKLVAADAARLRFYWAACEDGFDAAYLSLVEGALKNRLEDKLAGGEMLACENKQGISGAGFDEDLVIAHHFGELKTTDAALLTDLLGAEPIRLAVPSAEFDHVP